MDTATCYTVIALLAALSGTLLYLLYRRGQPIGECRQFRPAVELPPTGALAADLYAAYRRAKPVAVGGATIPLALAGCGEEVQAAWRAVAQHVEEICQPRGPVIPAGPTAALCALAIGALLCACTPLQQQAARDRAAAGALDFAVCAGADVPQPLINGLAAAIDGRDTWRADLIGAGGAAVRCGLLALVRQLAQASTAADGGEVGVAARASALQVDQATQVRQLAERCERGPCTDLRERAAWLLAKGGAR